MKAFFEKLLDLLFPPRCPFCRALLKDHERLICGKCRRELPWTPEAAQTQIFPHIDACLCPLYYEADVRASLLRFKFGGLSVYAPRYAELLGDCVEGKGLSFDLITWVPLGPKRLKKRGYDQARLMAEALAARLEKPCEQLLHKVKDNPPQSGTDSPQTRKANVKGVYEIADAQLVKGKSVLIVDDIVTTGATLGECARVLRSAGARSRKG